MDLTRACTTQETLTTRTLLSGGGKLFNWLTGFYPKKMLEAAHAAREEKKSRNFEQCESTTLFFFFYYSAVETHTGHQNLQHRDGGKTLHFSRPKGQFP